jgi:hypothetical protein
MSFGPMVTCCHECVRNAHRTIGWKPSSRHWGLITFGQLSHFGFLGRRSRRPCFAGPVLPGKRSPRPLGAKLSAFSRRSRAPLAEHYLQRCGPLVDRCAGRRRIRALGNHRLDNLSLAVLASGPPWSGPRARDEDPGSRRKFR